MSVTTLAEILSRAPASGAVSERTRTRRITPEAGRALELLGHAIEYLADDYMHRTTMLRNEDPEVAAIQLLMSLNREVYYECPLAETLKERMRRVLRL